MVEGSSAVGATGFGTGWGFCRFPRPPTAEEPSMAFWLLAEIQVDGARPGANGCFADRGGDSGCNARPGANRCCADRMEVQRSTRPVGARHQPEAFTPQGSYR